MASISLPVGASSSLKRKRAHTNDKSEANKKRGLYKDARAITAQTSGKAFGNGEMDVDKFLKARQFEIKALEVGLKKSKKILSTRGFQEVPRDLRRRTASHNVKRVPKRLRSKAMKEMVEDHTPTSKKKRWKSTTRTRMRLEAVRQSQALGRNSTSRKTISEGQMSESSLNKRSDKYNTLPISKNLAEAHLSSTTVSLHNKEKTVMCLKHQVISKKGIVKTRPARVKKTTLQKPPQSKSKFRKRQINKAWLPTHVFHAKRCHMTPPKEPLWRMAIPLSPTAKCYRPTHQVSHSRGGIAWDMSYISTIGLEGLEKSIRNLLVDLGVGSEDSESPWSQRGSRWTNGSRSWTGWCYARSRRPQKAIAPVQIVWCPQLHPLRGEQPRSNTVLSQSQTQKRKAFIRVHPSAFLQLWGELVRLSKVQKPSVVIEDLRFEIGSIDVIGPAAAEALVGCLWPTQSPVGDGDVVNTVANIWQVLSSVQHSASLPANALLGMEISDPRLHRPQRPLQQSSDPASYNRLLDVLSNWPMEQTQISPRLFDREARHATSSRLLSQKAISRRQSSAPAGAYPEAAPKDPKIPILVLVSREFTASQQGVWTVLLPWKCVAPVWYSLLYYPLSTGGTIRFGGLNEKRQIALESGMPWFPGDFPGTKAGILWEMQERKNRKAEWEKRPKGKRVEYDSLDIGSGPKGEIGFGWACGWERLVQENVAIAGDCPAVEREADRGEDMPVVHHIPASVAATALARPVPIELAHREHKGGLMTVRLTLLTRGVSTTCARIYRLPTQNGNGKAKWLSLAPSAARKVPTRHFVRQHLAASLLSLPVSSRVEEIQYPDVPGVEDLIGFVTTGNFNLREGRGTGIGCLLLVKVLETVTNAGRGGELEHESSKWDHYCIVRNAGEKIGRLARWEIV